MAMLVKSVPTFLLHVFAPVLGVCLMAWFVVLIASVVTGKGSGESAASPRRGLGKSAWVGLFALAVACTALCGKNTNGVQNLPPRPVLQLPAPTPPSILDYPRTITAARVASGIALVGVGTNETFTFDPPTNAVVCDDWRMHGSASRWTDVTPANFSFPFGGMYATTFTFLPSGVAYLADGADAPRLLPFGAEMGVAPERLWDGLGVTSRLWTAASPSNTFLATLQGALLNRSTDSPVDVQVEFFPDGGFDFRYDLSRCGATALPDVRIGAWNAGGGEIYSVPHRNLTSARWRPVVPEDGADPDRDNDGVTTVDELFFHGTDPGNPDSDFDGLSDGQEIALGLAPLDPYSNGGPYSDGFATALGGEDPLACPQGSEYTIYEHVVYSGTTNGTVSIPESTASSAVLEVSVSGTGTGDLVVGGTVLPLVAGAPAACIPVPRGDRLAVRLRRRTGSLSLAVDSDDFAIGEMPGRAGGDPSGWICFPRTDPDPFVACIHDLRERKIAVRIDAGPGAAGLSCLWWGSDAVSASNHADGVSSTLTGNFDAHCTALVMYTLDHPLRLLGTGSFWQAVRFCPRPADADDEPNEYPHYESGPDAPGENDDLYGTADAEVGVGCLCCDHCGSCTCHAGEVPSGVSGPVPEENPGDPPATCPEHNTPYAACAELHEDDAPRTVAAPLSTHVLTVGRTPSVDAIALTVPTDAVNCCPCPHHWTNYVGVAYKSGHLSVLTSSGDEFERSETGCTVYARGLTPTYPAAGAPLAFVTNGAVSVRRNYAVLGVDIDTPQRTAGTLNALSLSFGVPATVCTNVSRAAGLDLVTRVRLAAGVVTIAAGGGAFRAWLDRSDRELPPLLLVDGETRPTLTMSLAKWRSLAELMGDEDEARTRIRVTSATPGARTLTFSFSAGGMLTDSVMQRITFVRPPLRLDITRDGSIDDGDAAAWHDGRTFYYWVNESKIYGDYIVPEREYTVRNTSDFVVNGTFDLVNLFPVALDFSSFTNAWKNNVSYTVKPKWGDFDAFNFCFADVPWSRAGSIQTTNITTTAGQTLASASLTALPANGYALPYSFITSFSEDSGLMVCEAKSGYDSLLVEIKHGDTLLYSYSVPMMILPVKEMYSWINSRRLSGDSVVRPTSVHRIWEEQNTKSLIFLHGANVNESQAEAWGDILFKRMWLAGVHADFYNVDWRSNIGGPANYQENASNAFVVASQLATTLSNIPGEKVIMAHSLGNMVVSSMIQDHGLQVSKYLMCNSAVPAEAYDTTLTPTNLLVHKEWSEYPRKSFANEWYKLFEDDVGDDRQLLTWSGRFADVVNVAVNFYSTGDHVLELYPNNNVWPTDGYDNWNQMFEHYSWHKQELWKGRKDIIARVGTTDWAGWSIRENMLGYNTIQPTNAWLMSGAELKTNTVFKLQPECMNTNSIPLLVRGAILTKGIPARTPACGAMKWGSGMNMEDSMVNLNDTTANRGVPRPNGWVIRPKSLFEDWGNRWLHSDMKDMAYFYVFKFFKKVKEEGELE